MQFATAQRGIDMGVDKQADVIVVGAGQAGCAAAQDLAMAGLSVRLLDRDPERVLKPCAGGITIKALNRYRFSIDSVVRERHDGLDISWNMRRRARLQAGMQMALMTDRPELDLLCREQARLAGAQLERCGPLRQIQQTPGSVRLETASGNYSAQWLVAADGANSRVRRLVQGGSHGRGAFAIEGLLARDQVSHWPGMQMDFGAVPGGYGWLFPKGDHVNVGLYLWRWADQRPNRDALGAYARQQLGSDALYRVQGYPLGTWAPRTTPVCGRVLFAGDAAGYTEALLGEGIYGALLSGQAAALAIAGEHQVAASYQQRMAAWREELQRVQWLARLFYTGLPLGYGVLRHGVGHPLARGLARGWTLGRTVRHWRRSTRFSQA